MTKGRPKNYRRISFIPSISGFTPYGDGVNDENKESIMLFFEEHEAIRLNDYQNLSQSEAAESMGVSRPTFTRIYMSARQKIAKALIEGRRVVIEGGKVQLDNSWRECKDCGAIFTIKNSANCALCGGSNTEACSQHFKK